MTEAQRSLVRIVSNYVRLFATLILALYWAPLLLRGVEDNAFGLIAFLGTTAGLAERIRGIINRSMVRELGVAYHQDDPKQFLEAVNCAHVVCLGAGLLTLLLHGGLMAVLHLFPVSEGILIAGYWFLVAKGIESFFTVVLAPIFNFYLIDERMPTYNFWLVAIRAANILAAIVLIAFFPLTEAAKIRDISNNVIIYGFLSAGIATLMLAIPVAWLVITDSRFRPRPSLVSRGGVKNILAVGGWNTSMIIATSSFIPATGAFMFALLGELGGRIFGFAMPLTYYVRQLATGMAAGLDAVTTRVTAGKSSVSLQHIIVQSTRLNGFVIFPAMAFIVVLANPIIQLWVGHKLDNPLDVAMTADLVRTLALGAIAMGISESWITIIYGAGYIHKVVPIILLGLVAFLAFTPVAIWMAPAEWEYLAPAFSCSLMITLSMLLGIAAIIAHLLKMRATEIIAPLTRPLISALVLLPILIAFLQYVKDWSLWLLIGAMFLYGGVYLILCWIYVLQKHERLQILGAVSNIRSRRTSSNSSENSTTSAKP